MMHYQIHQTATPPIISGQVEQSVWRQAETLRIAHFHPQSSAHHPQTAAQVLYDAEHLYVRFQVQDQYVRGVYTRYQDPVYQDSCVEFFVMPHSAEGASGGYFNFEINCLGALLLYYIEDPRRTRTGFEKYTPVPAELMREMSIVPSLPKKVDAEIAAPLTWEITYNIPLTIFEYYLGTLQPEPGAIWRGNFYKCGDQTSHPHWASWSPIGTELNFHQPNYFGRLEFG
jgi:hypothetical protein